jgi:hypothetical protein
VRNDGVEPAVALLTIIGPLSNEVVVEECLEVEGGMECTLIEGVEECTVVEDVEECAVDPEAATMGTPAAIAP